MTAPRCIQTFRHAEGQTKHVNNFTFLQFSDWENITWSWSPFLL